MTTAAEVEADLLLDAVDAFAVKAEARLFAAESADGDLAAIGDLLVDAGNTGLLADVDDDAGHWGVWGGHVDEHGLAFSLATLRRLGRVCAGLATAVHAQGLGVLLLGAGARGSLPAGARLGAGFCPPYGLVLDPRTTLDRIRLDGDRVTGTARFVLAAGAPDAVVLAVHPGTTGTDEHDIVVLPADAPHLRLVPSGPRVGLRAVTVGDVVADGAPVTVADRRHTGPGAGDRLRTAVAVDWLGQAAAALGCAEQAIVVARDYSRTRHQGGGPISGHAAIRLLLSRAEHDVAVVTAVLDRHATTPLSRLDTDTLLRWAVDARLAAGEHAGRAVTDALQTLGGYGYMDDYGLSKRLRDLTALRVLHGSRDQLLLLRNDLEVAS